MFELKLNNGEVIPLKWGYYAMKRFAKRVQLSPTEYFDTITITVKLASELDNILYCAAEYAALSLGKPFTATELEVCEWIDNAGGLVNGLAEGGQLSNFLNYVGKSHIVNTSDSVTTEEKKN